MNDDPLAHVEWQVSEFEARAADVAGHTHRAVTEFAGLWGIREKEARRRRFQLRSLLVDLMEIVGRATVEQKGRYAEFCQEAGIVPSQPTKEDPYAMEVPAEWPVTARWVKSAKLLARSWDCAAMALREENRGNR